VSGIHRAYGPKLFVGCIGTEVNRNHSYNAILSGVMLDLVDEDPPPYFHTLDQWKAIGAEREKLRQTLLSERKNGTAPPKTFLPAKTESEAAERLFEEVERMRLWNPVGWATQRRRFYGPLLRWYLPRLERDEQAQEPPLENKILLKRLATCCYHLGLYAKWEEYQKMQGLLPAREIEKALRWDGKTSYSGKGYETVSAYLAEHGRKAILTDREGGK